MKLIFKVEVTVGRSEDQPLNDFNKSDGPAMNKYLKEKIVDALENAWQYNAVVKKLRVTKSK